MKLKMSRFIFCILLVILALPACNFLDNAPEGELTLEEVFNDRDRTRQWLAGIYNGVPDPYMPMLQNYDAYADDFSPSTGWGQFGWDCIDKIQGNWNANSSWGGNFWANLPVKIRQAYIFLENVKPIPEQSVSQELVDRQKGEARFLIAYYYYLLVNTYGAIPLQIGLANFNDSFDELMIGQTPYDEVIDWIDQELLAVSKILPPSYPLTDYQDYGRATSVMALAVRARMLLFAASPLVNGNPDYKGYVNNEGEEIFNSVPDATKWERAVNACDTLIEVAEANGYELYKEYNADGTPDPFMSYMNMSFVEYHQGNHEIIFPRAQCDYAWVEGTAAPVGWYGQGGMGVTQSLVDAFFMNNGLSPILEHTREGGVVTPLFNDDPAVTNLYSEKGFSTSDYRCKTQWHYGSPNGPDADGYSVVAPAGTFNMYVNREPRFYVSVFFDNEWYPAAERNLAFGAGEVDGRSDRWWDSPQNGYLLRKRIHPDSDIRDNIRPYRPGILFRMGEAYLNYAEALNEWDPSQVDEIVRNINIIRERAGIPLYGAGPDQIPIPQGQVAMREAIKRERRVEFNCEYAIRFDDIRRWKEIDLLAGPFDGMNAQGSITEGAEAYNENNDDAFYIRKTYINRAFTDKNYWIPIHQNQLDKNPNLRQLPGW